MEKKRLTGLVVQDTFGKGSKSEHGAVYLDTGKQKFKLKKHGGSPFGDRSLSKLSGKKIAATGYIKEYYFEIIGEPEILD
jgi:hypothetical protein